MKVLVCGGRDYKQTAQVQRVLSAMHETEPMTLVISGGARGVDLMGANWAYNAGIKVVLFRARWSEHGLQAGPIRNQMMLDEGKPDRVVAFPGGRGTQDMIA